MVRNHWRAVFALSVLIGLARAAEARVVERWNDLSLAPRVIRYDADKDQFTRQESVFSTIKHQRPGGRHSYSGSRLNQYRFHGKPGRGGIYDALEASKRHLDPRNYEYRKR
ncbi:MAG TPA: hypothetical protein VFW87_04900 [Pirellulales bacterium]|nr:hypothetical protein [Pirellulales bacterium]